MIDNPDWLIKQTFIINHQEISYCYDQESDILEIIFQKGGGLGIDLTENIVLRYNPAGQQLLSLIFTSYAHLIQSTPFGPPSFQLTQLTHLPDDIQQTVFSFLNTQPLNQFLKVSGLHPSSGDEGCPIISLDSLPQILSETIPA